MICSRVRNSKVIEQNSASVAELHWCFFFGRYLGEIRSMERSYMAILEFSREIWISGEKEFQNFMIFFSKIIGYFCVLLTTTWTTITNPSHQLPIMPLYFHAAPPVLSVHLCISSTKASTGIYIHISCTNPTLTSQGSFGYCIAVHSLPLYLWYTTCTQSLCIRKAYCTCQQG